MLQNDEFSQIFVFDQDTRTLVLDPQIQKAIKSRKFLPKSGTYELQFEINSDILGKATHTFSMTIEEQNDDNEDEASTFYFDFASRFKL